VLAASGFIAYLGPFTVRYFMKQYDNQKYKKIFNYLGPIP
jgi:hypothetical protein